MSLLAACSAPVDGTSMDGVDGDERDPSSVHGAVVLEQHVSFDGDEASSRVSARFLRLQGGMARSSAERIVAAPAFDVDGPEGCRVGDDVADVAPTDGSIELLDVGDVTLHVVDDIREDSVPLAARAFPDVGDLVSGVVYTSRESQLMLPAAATYLIETSGSTELEGFTVQAEPPDAPQRVRLSGSRSHVVDGEPLELTWDVPAEARGDRIQAELRVAGSSEVLRCTLDDDGYARVAWPASLVDPAGSAAGQTLELTVHRHRREITVPVASIDDVVVEFDFSTQARFLVIDRDVVDEG